MLNTFEIKVLKRRDDIQIKSYDDLDVGAAFNLILYEFVLYSLRSTSSFLRFSFLILIMYFLQIKTPS